MKIRWLIDNESVTTAMNAGHLSTTVYMYHINVENKFCLGRNENILYRIEFSNISSTVFHFRFDRTKKFKLEIFDLPLFPEHVLSAAFVVSVELFTE